jgi:hypothetical protein
LVELLENRSEQTRAKNDDEESEKDVRERVGRRGAELAEGAIACGRDDRLTKPADEHEHANGADDHQGVNQAHARGSFFSRGVERFGRRRRILNFLRLPVRIGQTFPAIGHRLPQ